MQQRLDIQRIADLRRRDEILRIAERHGAHNVRIFGSVARGEARPDSDLDVLVDLDDGRTALDLSELTSTSRTRSVLGWTSSRVSAAHETLSH